MLDTQYSGKPEIVHPPGSFQSAYGYSECPYTTCSGRSPETPAAVPPSQGQQQMAQRISHTERGTFRREFALSECVHGVWYASRFPLSKSTRAQLGEVRRVYRVNGRQGVLSPVYVLLARNADGIAKIGYSGDPESRAAQLRAAGPYDWRVCVYYGFGGVILENRMHSALAAKRVVGEIFEGALDDIVGATTVCARAYLRGK